MPPALAQEFYRYQQCQLENNTQFYHNLNDTMELLRQLVSPFYEQARALLDAADLPNHPLDDSFQTLFLQRWRISLTLQATMLHHQLLEQEREQLMAELQERPALSGALEPLLSENDTAAGRLWDMSKGQLQRGDYQRLVEYGNFAAAAGAESWRSSWAAAIRPRLCSNRTRSPNRSGSWCRCRPRCRKK